MSQSAPVMLRVFTSTRRVTYAVGNKGVTVDIEMYAFVLKVTDR